MHKRNKYWDRFLIKKYWSRWDFDLVFYYHQLYVYIRVTNCNSFIFHSNIHHHPSTLLHTMNYWMYPSFAIDTCATNTRRLHINNATTNIRIYWRISCDNYTFEHAWSYPLPVVFGLVLTHQNTNTPDLRGAGRLVQKSVDERAIQARQR